MANDAILRRLQRVINKITLLGKRQAFQFEGTSFYPSEVHLMVGIEQSRSTNITRIAEEMGVTKGAVSQTLTRLERKGVLRKTSDPSHKNELTLTLTPFGQDTFRHYQKLVAKVRAPLARHLDSVSSRDRAAIAQFLEQVEAVFNGLD